jgi:hypothetical protein
MRAVLLCIFTFIELICHGQMAAYTVSSIPFIPISIDTGATSLGLEDESAALADLGFSFTYFENTYQSVKVSSNGFVQFGPYPGIITHNFNYPLPSPNIPVNAIYLAGIDLDPSINSVRHKTIGTAPNRIFILEYLNVSIWSCFENKFTGQLRLYEGSNAIEMHITEFTGCGEDEPVWNGFAIQGIQNAAGNLAFVVENRDLDVYWEALEESWRFDRYIVDTTQQYTIGGRVWLDVNGNCEVDEEDTPIMNQVVNCQPGNLTATTDSDGYYSFDLFPTSLFAITSQIPNALQASHVINCPNEGSYSNVFLTSSEALSQLNFLVEPQIVCSDVTSIINHLMPDVPCNQAARTHCIEVSNKQYRPSESFFVKLQLPEAVHFLESNPPINISDGNSFIWIINDSLNYQESKFIYWKDSLICGKNSLLPFCREVEIINEVDCNQSNNSYLICEDPQSPVSATLEPSLQVLKVLPIPIFDDEYAISQNSTQYFFRFHFQNTGAETIQDLEISDSLANFFYPQIFDVQTTTHPCTTERIGNKIRIIFPNIQLPPASVDPVGSHLSIVFRLGADITLQPGDTVYNNAQLIVNGQSPIETNEIKIYMPDNSASLAGGLNQQTIQFVPNPASQLVSISGEFHNHDLIMVDMLGREVRRTKLQGKNPSIDLNGVSHGIYNVTISSGSSAFSKLLFVHNN